MTAELIISAGGVEVYHADHLALLERLLANTRPDGTVCDLTWLDAPYSAKTHGGHDDGAVTANRARDWAMRPRPDGEQRANAIAAEMRYVAMGNGERRRLNYAAWSACDVSECVEAWEPVTRGWFVTITDEYLAPHWRNALERQGRYVFGAIPYVAPGSRVRMIGDGPPCWGCWMIFARPRSHPWNKWNTSAARAARGNAPPMPGAYVHPDSDKLDAEHVEVYERRPLEAYVLPPGEGMGHTKRMEVVGGKPPWLHRSVIEQTSARGDIVIDPTCGGGGAGALAHALGRKAIIGDVKREHAEIASAALLAAIEDEKQRLAEEAARAAYMPPPARKEQIGLFTEEHRR